MVYLMGCVGKAASGRVHTRCCWRMLLTCRAPLLPCRGACCKPLVRACRVRVATIDKSDTLVTFALGALQASRGFGWRWYAQQPPRTAWGCCRAMAAPAVPLLPSCCAKGCSRQLTCCMRWSCRTAMCVSVMLYTLVHLGSYLDACGWLLSHDHACGGMLTGRRTWLHPACNKIGCIIDGCAGIRTRRCTGRCCNWRECIARSTAAPPGLPSCMCVVHM
jgi:hypothetical protein